MGKPARCSFCVGDAIVALETKGGSRMSLCVDHLRSAAQAPRLSAETRAALERRLQEHDREVAESGN